MKKIILAIAVAMITVSAHAIPNLRMGAWPVFNNSIVYETTAYTNKDVVISMVPQNARVKKELAKLNKEEVHYCLIVEYTEIQTKNKRLYMNAEEKIAVTKLDCSDGSMAKIDFDENMQPNDDQLPSSLTKSL